MGFPSFPGGGGVTVPGGRPGPGESPPPPPPPSVIPVPSSFYLLSSGLTGLMLLAMRGSVWNLSSSSVFKRWRSLICLEAPPDRSTTMPSQKRPVRSSR